MNDFEYILLSVIIAIWQCYNIRKIKKLEEEVQKHRGFIRKTVSILDKHIKDHIEEEKKNENSSNENN